MRIALSQITSGPEPERNLSLLREQAGRAAEAGARVVVFPEAAMACFGGPLGELAEPLDGPWATEVRRIAEDAGVVVVAGMFTPAPDGRVRNTVLATGGGVEAAYDKIHLYDAFGFAESRTVAPGSEVVTFELDGVRIGLATCYDVRFPELFRAHADAGAVLSLLPASWGAGPGKREQWELLTRARALDATVWLAAVGQADPAASGQTPTTSAPTGIGHSALIGPDGTVRQRLDAGPGLLVGDVDVEEVGLVRRKVSVLANRRPGLHAEGGRAKPERAKPELEFHRPDGEWEAPEGAAPGVREQTLAVDGSGGRRTALVRWEPGTDTSASGVVRHDFWEEVYLVEGDMRDLTLGRTFSRGEYACRPPGMPHGPWISEGGVTMLVVTYPS